jgi:outer membrane protein assembly factor BamB
MATNRFRYKFLSALLLLPFLGSQSVAQDWPEFRGADGTGLVTADGILTRNRRIGLKTRWKKKLGSGYSSVVVSGEKVVTMYSDETNDLIGCFAAKDGETLWSVPIGSRFKGENGSFDGPISTPLIRDGRVFGLSPMGKMYCLSLEDGSEIWSRDFLEENVAVKPLYGFATSPILVEDTLVLQLGAMEKSLTGLNPETGETKWACSSDRINSQSPALIEIEGKQIVLAAGGKNLTGVSPVDGSVLFEHPHEGRNGSAMIPVVFDKNKVLMTLDDGFSTAVSIRAIGDGYQVSEEWKERSIKNTYNVPVEFEGCFYAYSTRILTCVDSATGTPKWKSREPADGFLIVVDGHVILNTKRGSLHVLRATPDSCEEIVGLKVFDDLVWSVPAYSKDAIFTRSLGELACVDLVGSTDSVANETQTKIGAEFSAMLAEAKASDAPQAIVDRYFESKAEFPLVENDLAHFVYQGEANDVAVAGDMFGARQERKMQQITGTNTWFYVAQLPTDVRLNYIYLVNFKPQTDPRNDRKSTSTIYAGEMEFAIRLEKEAPLEMSWFGMPDWNEPSFLEPVEQLRGEIVTKTIPIPTKTEGENPQATEPTPRDATNEGLEVKVYLPPGYQAGDDKYPVVYVFDGSAAMKHGRLHELADQMFSGKSEASEKSQAPKAILVFVDRMPVPGFADLIATSIVPFVDENFRTIPERTSRACMANGLSSSVAFQMVTKHESVFGIASAQTPLVFDAGQQQAVAGMKALKKPTQVFLEWGTFDMFNPDENWDSRKIGKKLFDEFSKSENVTMHGGEVADSTDWASWRNRFDLILKMFDSAK